MEGKFGEVSVRLMGDGAKISDASVKGEGCHRNEKFGLGYSGQRPIDQQAIIEQRLLGGLKTIFVKGEIFTEKSAAAKAANGDGLKQLVNNYWDAEEEADKEPEE